MERSEPVDNAEKVKRGRGSQLAFWRRPANKTLLLAGLACGVAALAGGGIKAAGFEFPLLTAGVSRWGLAGLAVVLVLASFYVRFGGEDVKDSPPLRIPAELPARNDHFTGRTRELALLSDALASGRRPVLCGLGGVGKSQLVV
jgi:hypothetical protein